MAAEALSLRADCERCLGLCCVAPAFAASADFAIDKPAGLPCHNLGPDSRCGIHETLREKGFSGCTVYDCFGAGQQVTQVTFAGRDWRQDATTARQMFDVFAAMRQLHELLWYLTEALALQPADDLHAELGIALTETERLTHLAPGAVLELDLAGRRDRINTLLLRVSELARGETGRRAIDRRGADLLGADLRGADLRCASLRGACLVGADLRGADLRCADVIGADFRGATISGADLSGAIFLTQAQLDSARGDAGTKLPASMSRPRHW